MNGGAQGTELADREGPGDGAQADRQPSLRSRLQRRVLVPLALTWLLGSGVTASVAYVSTSEALDRSLLDDAYALAANITETHDREVTLNLTPREMSTLLFDQSEKIFFAVRRADGRLVAGHAGLPMAPADAERLWTIDDRFYNGNRVRVVTLHRAPPQDFVVAVAQTVRSRTEVLQRLLVQSFLPQALLLIILGLWLHRTVGRELEPLMRLQHELRDRQPSDLSAIKVATTTRDVAQLAAAASSLLSRIAAGVRSQREFAGNVAHELRTPLAGIRALAEHGLNQGDPLVWRAQLQAIIRSEDRASHLVEQLLALARAYESEDGLVLGPVALDEMVRDILLRTMARADALRVDLGAEGVDEPVWVRGHAALLDGLIVNLVDNALKHGRPSDPAIAARVTVSVSRPARGTVLLSVCDNGCGLNDLGPDSYRVGPSPRWVRERSEGSSSDGAGLGLSICHRYAQLLDTVLELGRPPQGSGLLASVALQPAAMP